MSETKNQPLDRLKERMKKVAAHVGIKVEAAKGEFKVVISETNIEQLYKGHLVGSVKVANLSEDEITAINEAPHSAAEAALDAFIDNVDPNKVAEIDNVVKTAANSAVTDETAHVITQKQLEEHDVKLHPRTNEYPEKVTQKQLPEAGQRPGTYDVTTQKQLQDERTTFYGEPRTAGDVKNENRNTVTEAQFEEGTKAFTELGQSDRGEMGAKFDGGNEKQVMEVTEKQIAELLAHHGWEEPHTTTEDQLKGQDGELARLTASTAQLIIKEAMDAFGKTVLAAGVTPNTVANVLKSLVSHPNKYPVLANVLKTFKQANTNVIEQKVEKTRYFGKVAHAGQVWKDTTIADVILRQLAKINADPRHVVDGLVAMAEAADLQTKIDKTAESLLKVTTAKTNPETNVFKQILAGEGQPVVEGSDDDGLYEYNGTVDEVTASVQDKDAFIKAATKHAEEQVKKIVKNANLQADKIDVDEEKGIFTVAFSDPAKTKQTLEARANARRQVKTAQTPGGGGGMPGPGAGAGMGPGSNPMVPPSGGDMNAPPPTESLTQPPPPPGEEEVGGGEAKPPGSICPVCGSEDVDIDNGEFNCNNCGGKGVMHVRIEVTKWPEVLQESSGGEKEKEGFGLGEGLGSDEAGTGPAANANEETAMPNVPVAASVRLTPLLLEKMASQKLELGKICPNCGSHTTDLVASATGHGKDGICWDCLTEYNLQVKADKNKKHNVVAQFLWTHNKAEDCAGCNRLKTAFRTSLKNYGMTWNNFKSLASMKEQGEVILKMAKAGVLNLTQAMNADLPIEKFAASARWNGYQKFDKFPSASCRERLARRFGENATAMSGPCEGQKLHECVCSQLEDLGIYTDGLAAKVASHLASPNPMINNPSETCVGMFVRDGFAVKEACTICDGLRAAYASTEDLVIEAVAQVNPALRTAPKPMASSMNPKPMMAPAKPMAAPGMAAPKPMSAPAKPLMDPVQSPMKPLPETEPVEEPAPEEQIGEELGEGLAEGVEEGLGEMPTETPAPIGEEPPLQEPMGEEPMTEAPVEAPMGGMEEPGMGEAAPMDAAQMQNILVNTFEDLVNALKGNVTPEEGMGGEFGDEFGNEMGGEMGNEVPGNEVPPDLDVSDVNEVVDNHEPEGDFGGEEIEDLPEDEEFSHDEATETPAEEHAESPEVQEYEEKEGEEPEHDFEKKEKVPGLSDDQKEDEPLKKESLPEDKEDKEDKEKEAASLDRMLMAMKNKTFKRQGSALDDLFDGLMKQAEKANDEVKKLQYKSVSEKKVTVKPAQDAEGLGKVQDGGKIGGEKPFADGVNKKPDVPRGEALLGTEEKEMTVSETSDMPSVPAGGDKMEGEENYDAEKKVVVDGNQGGQKAASRKI